MRLVEAIHADDASHIGIIQHPVNSGDKPIQIYQTLGTIHFSGIRIVDRGHFRRTQLDKHRHEIHDPRVFNNRWTIRFPVHHG